MKLLALLFAVALCSCSDPVCDRSGGHAFGKWQDTSKTNLDGHPIMERACDACGWKQWEVVR